MATLKTNTLTGTSTAGSIAVTGEGGSTTTNLQQGLAKMFVHAANDATPDDSFNVSSQLDNATGDYSYTYTNNMRASDTYSSHFAILQNNQGFCYQRTNSTTTVRVDCVDNNAANQDRIHGGSVVGDLA